MKNISIDFDNNMICIMTDGQQGTEQKADLKKVAFNSFIPEEYRDCSSYNWNFELNTFSVNHPYMLHPECIMTKECFVPKLTVPMPGLNNRFEEFIAILGYEAVNLIDAFPAALRSLLRFE